MQQQPPSTATWLSRLGTAGAHKSSARTSRNFQFDVPEFAFACLPKLQQAAAALAGTVTVFQCFTQEQHPIELQLSRAQFFVQTTHLSTVLAALDEYGVPFSADVSRVHYRMRHGDLPSAARYNATQVYPALLPSTQAPKKRTRLPIPEPEPEAKRRKTLGARRPRFITPNMQQ